MGDFPYVGIYRLFYHYFEISLKMTISHIIYFFVDILNYLLFYRYF